MHNFFLRPMAACHVKCGIFKQSSKKVTGDDDILGKHNPNTFWHFTHNLGKIWHDFIANGEYPQQTKIARVIALYTKEGYTREWIQTW